MYDLSVYEPEFFAVNQREGLRHAEWFCPLLIEIFAPATLVDIGCGTGHFVKWFDDRHTGTRGLNDQGVRATGLEGSPHGFAARLSENVYQFDLRKPLSAVPKRKADLAISIEVAEHIEQEFAGTFVDTLCALSDTVMLTAAPPGQGGFQHVNEQPQQYWMDLFAARGFEPGIVDLVKLRMGIDRAVLGGFHVANWWYKNIQVYRRANANQLG